MYLQEHQNRKLIEIDVRCLSKYTNNFSLNLVFNRLFLVIPFMQTNFLLLQTSNTLFSLTTIHTSIPIFIYYFLIRIAYKHAIYRILQEALANVTKHSSADYVVVTLSFKDKSVELCINDDGVGFDVLQPHDGIGLDSMRERAESLEGDFSIQSEPRQGTKICITIPIE